LIVVSIFFTSQGLHLNNHG